ncbi:MAG: hypothetical protein H7X95_11930 [Deltaproteobacteria bacterium]|nr:hypothetical protein [Deltaproteobacteria bacterium]
MMSVAALIPVLVVASATLAAVPTRAAVAANQAFAQVEQSRRSRRPIALTVAPDLYVLHAQKFGDMVVAPLVLRLTGNCTSRFSVTASYGSTPNIMRVYDVGAAIALFETAVTPYAGVTAGVIHHFGDDGPDTTDRFVVGVVGVTFLSVGGLDLSAEGAAGYQAQQTVVGVSDGVMVRMGLRLGYRFAFGS